MREQIIKKADEILKTSGLSERDVRNRIQEEYGWAVAEQFDDIFEGESLEDQNPNALEYIAKVLRRTGDEEWEYMVEEIEDYLRSIGGPPKEDLSAY